MEEMTRILWSGLSGRTGQEAMKQVAKVDGVEIVAGMKRFSVFGEDDHWLRDENFKNVQWLDFNSRLYGSRVDYGLIRLAKQSKANVLVDFSHYAVFERVLDLAIRMNIPLVVGTSGLSNRQMAMLYSATDRIPVFRGGNFRFKVKDFIDEAVKLAMATPGNLTLYENFYEGKSLPSKTSRVMQKRIQNATDRTIEVQSSATLDKTDLPCDWRIGDLHCHTVGFDELAHDVLEIAKVMAKKPVRPGKFYDLDEIWEELPH